MFTYNTTTTYYHKPPGEQIMNHMEQHVADKILAKAIKAKFFRGTKKWVEAYSTLMDAISTRSWADRTKDEEEPKKDG